MKHYYDLETRELTGIDDEGKTIHFGSFQSQEEAEEYIRKKSIPRIKLGKNKITQKNKRDTCPSCQKGKLIYTKYTGIKLREWVCDKCTFVGKHEYRNNHV